MNRNRNRVHSGPVVLAQQGVCERGGAHDERRYTNACEIGRQNEVQRRVGERCECAEVEGEVEAREEIGGAEGEEWGIAALRVGKG